MGMKQLSVSRVSVLKCFQRWEISKKNLGSWQNEGINLGKFLEIIFNRYSFLLNKHTCTGIYFLKKYNPV